jgi:hypothetical protein
MRSGERTVIARVEATLRWGAATAVAGVAVATLAAMAAAGDPGAVAACLPPAVGGVDLACLGRAGLAPAGMIALAALVLLALGGTVQAWRSRQDQRLVAAGVRDAASRALHEVQEGAAAG